MSITNLVGILVTVMTTNVVIRPETRPVGVPCPEGRIGCLVFHSKEEPVEHPAWRDVVTEVREITTLRIAEFGIEHVVSNRVVSSVSAREGPVVTWRPMATNQASAGGVLLGVSSDMHFFSYSGAAPANTFNPMLNLSVTNLGIVTNAPALRIQGQSQDGKEMK